MVPRGQRTSGLGADGRQKAQAGMSPWLGKLEGTDAGNRQVFNFFDVV